MTLDETLHFIGGFWKAMPARFASSGAKQRQIFDIDLWAWSRELAQHPGDDVLTPHQIAEAMAWGRGARVCLRINPAYPVPPYPTPA